MSISIEKKNDSGVVLRFRDYPISLLNSFRRILLSEIPTYTIDTILVEINNTCYNDEFLAHRLALIPFYFEEHFPIRSFCPQFNCINCCPRVELQRRNDTNEILPLYSSDFEIVPHTHCTFYPVVYPEFPKGIMIGKLKPKTEIHLQCKLRKGLGKVHSKWSSVSTIFIKKVDSNSYDLHIESNGSHATKTLVEKTFDIWSTKINELIPIK